MSFHAGPLGFVPFDPARPVRRYRRHLPHWVQDGCTYFITFRLADSIPATKRKELEDFRICWQRDHSAAGDDEPSSALHKETLRLVETWLDAGSGSCILRDDTSARLIENALLHFHNQRYELGAHCVMPNHVHVLVRPLPGHEPEEILKSWKSFTAREINRRLERSGSFWAQESCDTIVRDAAHLAKVLRYIGSNPAKAGIPRAHWHRWVNPDWQRVGWDFAECVVGS